MTEGWKPDDTACAARANGHATPGAATADVAIPVGPSRELVQVYAAIFDNHDPERVAAVAKLVNGQHGLTNADLLALSAIIVASVLVRTEKHKRILVMSGVMTAAVEMVKQREVEAAAGGARPDDGPS